MTRCSDQTIRWTAGATSGTFKVEYTLDGSTWVSIVDEHSGTATGNNSKSWRAPDVLTSNLQYRITDVEDTTKTDTSLTVLFSHLLILLYCYHQMVQSPLYLEPLSRLIMSMDLSTTGVSFKIRYAEDKDWQGLSVDNSFSDGQATFTVPNIPTSSARIRVLVTRDNGCDYDHK